jgi:hypothetical protein
MKLILLGYIDPGFGALIWQSVMGAFVGLLFYLKKTRQWIVRMSRKLFSSSPKPAEFVPAPAKVSAAKVLTETETA